MVYDYQARWDDAIELYHPSAKIPKWIPIPFKDFGDNTDRNPLKYLQAELV
jgi:hypothetical protein